MRLPSGSSVTYKRDRLGRLVTRIEPEGTTDWEYDTALNGIGLISKVNSSTLTKTFTYDMFSRETQVVNTILSSSKIKKQPFYSFSTNYDNIGRISSQKYPSNFSVYNCFNQNGYLLAVSMNDPTCSLSYVWKALDYDASNNILSEQDKNGIVTSYSLNAFSQVTNIQTKNTYGGSVNNGQASSVLVMRSLDYEYNAKKNLIKKTDRDIINNLDNIIRYEYDSLDRITGATQSRQSTMNENIVKQSSWAYDSIGNI